jgi:NADPH-dependent 2,4-dienoyl-CoA reductase/sulfur reductase-like enzyme
VSADPEVPYHRPPLSKAYLLDKETRESVFVKPRSFYDTAGVTLHLGTRILSVNPAAHTVTTDAKGTHTYKKVLLATGCSVRKLSVPGSTLPRIYYLRTLADADALKAAAARATAAVVIGGSFIGMELASAFAQKGLRTTVLHRGAAVFEKLGSKEASAFFARYFTERGVTIRTEDGPVSFEKETGEQMIRVLTARKDMLSADLVAVGVGVVPDTDYLGPSGLHLDNGVQVNEYLEASLPDVYAAGDIANFFDPLYGRHRRIEHWDTAIQHGKVAGSNMAGRRMPYAAVSYFYSDVFDLNFEYFGDSVETDQIVQLGSFDDRAVTLFFTRENVIRAAFTMGRPKERKALIELIRSQQSLADLDALINAPLDTLSPFS